MTLSRRLSIALAVVAGATGAMNFIFWKILSRDTPAGIGNLRGTALTLVVLVLPVMLIAMNAADRGSLRARLVWLSCLAYVAYNAVMFCFASHFNAFFLGYTAMLALSFWAIVTLMPTIDPGVLAGAASGMRVRFISAYLFASLALFAALWLRAIIPATLSNEMPRVITESGLTQNAVWVLDFGFTFPLMLLGALWLWQRKAWGYLIGGMMVVMLTLETAGVAVDQWFGYLHDSSAPLGAIPIMIALTGAGAWFSTQFLRGVRPDDREAPAPA
jgi:hypothetical protein